MKSQLVLVAVKKPKRKRASTRKRRPAQKGRGVTKARRGGRRRAGRQPKMIVVQGGQGFFGNLWKGIKKGARGVAKVVTDPRFKAGVKGGLDVAQMYGSPKVKAGAGTARGLLSQVGYGRRRRRRYVPL